MKMKKFAIAGLIAGVMLVFAGCDYDASEQDAQNAYLAGTALAEVQPTPTDINYSLERYNLIRRTYWVNGQREKANKLESPIEKPMGYIVLFNGGTIVGRFTVDGKVSSLNSFLTPDTDYPSYDSTRNNWLPDVDGSYGENDNGIFFFTPDGNYVEWTGEYIYSDIPMDINDPALKIETTN